MNNKVCVCVYVWKQKKHQIWNDNYLWEVRLVRGYNGDLFYFIYILCIILIFEKEQNMYYFDNKKVLLEKH